VICSDIKSREIVIHSFVAGGSKPAKVVTLIMKKSLLLNLLLVTAAWCVVLQEREDKGICDCPTQGPRGTCLIKPVVGADRSKPGSANCEGIGFYYVCGGSYDQPNCVGFPLLCVLERAHFSQNVCAQSLWGNYAPADRSKQCDGAKVRGLPYLSK
jgi:hypothetical protein